MIYHNLSIRLGGFAGDGLQSTGNLLQKFFNKLGYYVQGFPGTQSTIRGGYVWQHVQIASEKIFSYDTPIDFLIVFRNISLEAHLRDVKANGFVLYNSDTVKIENFEDEIKKGKINVIGVPMSSMARDIDIRAKVLINTIAVGFLLDFLSLDINTYINTLEKRFKGRNDILEMNQKGLKEGMNYYKQNYSHFNINLETPKGSNNQIVISGNEMIALGAAASGLKFLAQYPITPASSILTYLSRNAKKFGIVVRQAEDELAAISMIIGASYAGARAMTASSGPGISLMAEGFGYASMTETPIVVVNAMRGGPSTGVPTKMEQADLNSAIYLSHGDTPRIVLAPRNLQECFSLTAEAFNLADIYQMPVIILSDFALSERTENLEPFELDYEINRGKIWTEPTDEFPVFKRHQFTDDGISPRVFPPTKEAMYIAVGAEHDESSHSLSGNRCGLPLSGTLREKMFEKRYKKLEKLRKEMKVPEFYGVDSAENTIICWGSTQGAIKEVIDFLNLKEEKWNMLCFSHIYPLPYEKVKSLFTNIKQSIMYEVNYSGQFEKLLHDHLDWKPNYRIHPMSGETPTPTSILNELSQVLKRRLI